MLVSPFITGMGTVSYPSRGCIPNYFQFWGDWVKIKIYTLNPQKRTIIKNSNWVELYPQSWNFESRWAPLALIRGVWTIIKNFVASHCESMIMRASAETRVIINSQWLKRPRALRLTCLCISPILASKLFKPLNEIYYENQGVRLRDRFFDFVQVTTESVKIKSCTYRDRRRS